MTILKYSFSLTPPAPPPALKHEYSYSEFLLDLAAKWRQIPADEDNTLNFQSDDDGAALIVSCEFLEIPDDKAQLFAEKIISSGTNAIQAACNGAAQVLQQSIKPHSSGTGLEVSYIAETDNDHVYLYLGYVTSRKVLNFSMVCQPGRQAAAALFNATVPGFRPVLP
jgi:hypothetical protein